MARYVFASGLRALTTALAASVIIVPSPGHSAGLGPWIVQPSMNVGREGHAVAATGGYVYALGGGNLAVLSSVEFAAVGPTGALSSWSFTTPLLTPRFTFGAVGIGNKLYAVGGWSTLGCCDGDTVYHRSVEIGTVNPDGTVATWTYGTELVEGMGVGGIATDGAHIYYVGGFGEAVHRSDRVQVADILPGGTLSAWRTTTPLTFGREGPGVAVAANRLYVFGGYLEGPIVDTAQSAPILANGDLGSWRDDIPMTVTRYGPTALAGQSKVFVGGGTFGAGGCLDGHASFEEAEIGPDGVLGPWMPSSSLTSGRFGHAGSLSGTTAVIAGGFSCAGARVDAESAVCLDCVSTTTTSTTSTTTTTIPADADGDGIPDAAEMCACADTPADVVVTNVGCSLEQLCPCAAPLGRAMWGARREYMSCVRWATRELVNEGRLTVPERRAVIRVARASGCGSN